MTPLPLIVAVLVVGAALVVVLLLLRRRRTPAVPSGPRTVAELVELRAAAAPTRVSAAPRPEPAVAVDVPAPAPPVAPAAAPPVAAPPAPAAAPVAVAAAPVGEPVALLGDDVPWRRAALMNAARAALPEPRSASAGPARSVRVARPLSGSSRRDRRSAALDRTPAPERAAAPPRPAAPDRAPAPDRTAVPEHAAPADRHTARPTPSAPDARDGAGRGGSSVRPVPAPLPAASVPPAPSAPAPAPVAPAPAPAAPVPVAPALAAPVPSAAPPAAPVPAAPVAPAPLAPAPSAVVPPRVDPPTSGSSAARGPEPAAAVPVRPPDPDPSPTDPSPTDPPAVPVPTPAPVPLRPTAEQAAADLALLRTFGAADLTSRPDRAPDVALTSAARPEPEPEPGAAQPVRFRVVRRGGEPIPDVAVALLDAGGRETAAARGATGELTAPRPGTYVLVATAAGHQAGAVALGVGHGPVDVELLLVRSAVLRGSVTGEDGPVAGARVVLVQDGEVVETADSDGGGAYRIDGLAAGEYAVSVAAAGCEPDIELVLLPDEAEVVHDVDLAPAGVAAGRGSDGG